MRCKGCAGFVIRYRTDLYYRNIMWNKYSWEGRCKIGYSSRILKNESVELGHKTAGRGLSVSRLGSDSDESVRASADDGN